MHAAPTQLSELPPYLLYVLLNPTFNPKVAFVLYATVGLLLLLFLAIGIALLMRPIEDDEASEEQYPAGGEEFERLEVGEAFEGLDLEGTPAVPRTPTSSRRVSLPPMSPRRRLAVAGVIALVLLAFWIAAGYSTSDSRVCKDCHFPAAGHAKAVAGKDPHAHAPCVSCHESGSVIGRYVTDVPARLIHFAGVQSGGLLQLPYGHVSVAACSSCHRQALTGVVIDHTRGLKISHKEPLSASATCLDCHALSGGIVATHNAGMTPCLRCHDGKRASAACGTCHDEKASSAARSRATTSFADVQIPNLSCGGCHDEKKECDSCHGIRMPHSTEFTTYAHARAAAVDFWYNGGKTCARCHAASRHPCQRCHSALLGKAHGIGTTSAAIAHKTATNSACDTCHSQYAYLGTRDFCKDLCHAPAAIAGSPR